MTTLAALTEKYNRQVARYTSYPTVPYWYDLDGTAIWEQRFMANFKQHNSKAGISLYLHLPFCESLCTYCACNKRITTNHTVEDDYIKAILKEWQLYCNLMDEKPVIRELHLGGGTPTFFSPENLEKLLTEIFKVSVIHPEKEFSIEGHPNNTTREHLETLFRLGFNRVSYGVQDNDPIVQKAINRIQPLENVRRATEMAREVGFKSVNFDLIYGLPFQTLEGEEKTIKEVIALQPDRIAFYSYAHVPWKQKAQRLFDETNLPPAHTKLQLYLLGKQLLLDAGYTDIGMDHFARPDDDLYIQWAQNKLHRNFMGYTTTHTKMLVGLGVSAISDTGDAFAQNHKELENYYRSIEQGVLPVTKGYYLNETDVVFKQYILDIICKGHTELQALNMEFFDEYTIPRLKELEEDGLLVLENNTVNVTETGRQFVRNICQAFDMVAYAEANNQTKKSFSYAV